MSQPQEDTLMDTDGVQGSNRPDSPISQQVLWLIARYHQEDVEMADATHTAGPDYQDETGAIAQNHSDASRFSTNESQKLSMTNQTHKNGDPPPYPSQQQPSGAMSTMHHRDRPPSYQTHPDDSQQFNVVSSQNQITEEMIRSAITQQPSRASESIYPSLGQFSGAMSHDDKCQRHPSDLPRQREESRSQSVYSQSTESTALTTNTVGPTTRHDAKGTPLLEKHVSLDEEKETSEDTTQHLDTSMDAGDVAALHVQIDLQGKELPVKWETVLEKGLQRMFNKTFQSRKITVKKMHLLDTPYSAKIIISPSKACEDLLNIKSEHLKLKDNSEAVVYFKDIMPLEDPSAVPTTLKQHESSMQKTQIPMTVSVEVPLCRSNPDQRKTSQEPMRVPLVHYWYLNHMHRKDIESIEERHGVKIEADVCVLVKETLGSNSEDASREFQDLVLNCAIDSVPVPNPIKLVEDIQSVDAKVMLNGSARNWRLVGPPVEVAQVQKMLKYHMENDEERPHRVLRDQGESMNSHRESRWYGPNGIEMNIPIDPLLNNGICISMSHWEIMTKALKQQLNDIQNKFGVDFSENNIHTNVIVKAQSTGKQTVNLEANAIRALLSLYQKVVMTTVNCSLQNASHRQTDMVKQYLEELRTQNPCLVVGEGSTGGDWMMIGLPDHLRFAVREIEKKFGSPVFNKKQKDIIECDQNAEFMRSFTDRPVWEGSSVYEAVGWEKGAASGVDHGSIDASIAYMRFEKGAGGSGAVDGAASSALYEEDGQKLGEAGRKTTKGFREEAGAGADRGGTKEDDNCPICMDEFTNEEKLPCGHVFCEDCLRQSIKSLGPSCPVCKKVFGKVEGDQPNGSMRHHIEKHALPGFNHCHTIVIDYIIPDGIQSDKHPKPGRSFRGTQRRAYLPDNKEGKEVLALLRRAFEQKLIFTVGTSRTSGMDDCVTWNDVHHKTNIHGGPQNFGYPDDGYLKRVREELKAKGVE